VEKRHTKAKALSSLSFIAKFRPLHFSDPLGWLGSAGWGEARERERERERERTSQQIYRGVIGDRVAEAAEGEGCPIRREAQQQRRGKMHFRSAGGRGKFRRTAKSPEELEEV
jgi:hypothetical protein